MARQIVEALQNLVGGFSSVNTLGKFLAGKNFRFYFAIRRKGGDEISAKET